MSGFEEHLKKFRTHAGLSQPELAQKVGVDKSYISKLERGVESPPSRKVVVKLADSLGMSNKPVTLYVSTQDISALERFTFLLEADAAGADDVKAIKVVAVEDETLEEEKQGSAAPIPTLAHPALDLSYSVLDAAFEQIEADIKSRHLSKEQLERLAAGLIEANRLLANMIKPEHE